MEDAAILGEQPVVVDRICILAFVYNVAQEFAAIILVNRRAKVEADTLPDAIEVIVVIGVDGKSLQIDSP